MLRSWVMLPVMLFRFTKALEVWASPRSKYSVSCALGFGLPAWTWIPTSLSDTVLWSRVWLVPSTTMPKPSPAHQHALRLSRVRLAAEEGFNLRWVPRNT